MFLILKFIMTSLHVCDTLHMQTGVTITVESNFKIFTGNSFYEEHFSIYGILESASWSSEGPFSLKLNVGGIQNEVKIL